MDKFLHIVSFNVPLPANYGGVIDVFYKIKSLHQEGVKIILHCFLYNRERNPELEKYCEKVIYYQRKSGLYYLFSWKPYIVLTRINFSLINKLSSDNYPVLFEGLHCCTYINNPIIKYKKKLVRIHNVEHQYYQHLAKNETNFLKKCYYKLEAVKLKFFEKQLRNANELLVLSKYDEDYYSARFENVNLIPPFHQYQKLNIEQNVEDYILFNADFTINFNYQFAKKLFELAKSTNQKLILAGKVSFENDDNLNIVRNPSDQELDHLVAFAFINIIPLEHPTGFKLKLVHALHRSKNIVLVGELFEELKTLKCNHVKLIPSLAGLPICMSEFKEVDDTISSIIENRENAIRYFDNQQHAKSIISKL